ncbi:UDP-N-acetylmuramate dehydrogenase [Peptoniphilaceae bacterium SGI.131]
MENKDIEELKKEIYGQAFIDEPMKNHTSFRVGGPADLLVKISSEDQLARLVKYCNVNNIPFMVKGNGSNMLVRDGGIRGVVVEMSKSFSKIDIEGFKVEAQAGALLSTLAKATFKQELTGMEAVSGIPASVGGAVAMNAGAYGTEMKDIVESVRCMDMEGNIFELSNEEMKFRYRGSLVFDKKLIVLSARFLLEKGDPSTIEAAYADYNYRRTSKQPLDKYSAGSTFKRPEGNFASALIDRAGLRGFTHKRAQVSEKHCGFLINMNDATCQEILELVGKVQDVVYDKFSVKLEMEVKVIGEDL